MLRYLFVGALALAAGSANAELVTVRYDFPQHANLALTWGFFGGELGPLTGHIVSTTLHVDYTTAGDQDAAEFYLTFDVPTYDGAQTHIGLTGTDLGWSGAGHFTYGFDASHDFDGEIRPGRFGAEFAGGGTLTDSYIEFVVDADLPDPIYADGFDPL
jgi:hypothetical protein